MTRATLLTLSLLLVTNWSHAADPAAAKAVKVLLDKGWEKTADARKLPDYDSLNKPPLSTDSSVLAARWLVLMHHNRYGDALTSLETFPQAKPSDDLNLAALRAVAWIHTVKQAYPQAMIDADQLAQAATPNPPAKDNATLEAQDEAAAFLGSLAGFLEGPCDKTADQTARTIIEEKALQRLNEPRKKAFTDAKAAVLTKYQKLSADLAEAKANSQQDAEKEKQEALAKLSDQLQKLSQEETKLENQRKQVKADLDKNIADLNRQDAPLQQTFVGLQGQITVANTNISQLQATIQNLQLQFNTEKDAAARQRLQNQIQQAQSNIGPARNLLSQLNGQVAGVVRQRKAIEQQLFAVNREATAETKKIEARLPDVHSEQKKIENKRTNIEKQKLGPSAKVLALQTEVQALSTYNEFPLAKLRDTLLKQVQ
jgi:predicted  nucleic acid-binding Zn-ribbon protein